MNEELLAGRYRTLRVLGAGGMARVFLAEDERLGRQVAVKRLHAHSPEDIGVRFQREARLGASLNHQNLVGVFDVETDGESVLIVMEYVEGTTLASELRTGALDPSRVVSVVGDVAAALDAVHVKGIVHRDVKPANVLIRTDGVAKLADLGIATLVQGTSITVSGTVLGTASYMAPEQIEGAIVGPAADVYALAAVAFEALSGRKARTGDTPMQVAHSVTHEEPPDIRETWPQAPPAVAAALTRGMSLRPEDRQRRAGELFTELRDGLSGFDEAPTRVVAPTRATRVAPVPVPVPAPQPAPPPPTPVPEEEAAMATHRGRRFPAGIAALAAAVLVLAAVGFLVLRGGDDPSSRSGSQAARPQPTDTAKTRTQATTPKAAGTNTATAPTGTSSTPTATRPTGETGAQLNARGYALLRGGDAAGALPLLRRAVDTYPTSATQLEYAFALFNLAQALRQTGQPAEAIPLLERRLSFSDNQRPVVEKELQTARQQAGVGTSGTAAPQGGADANQGAPGKGGKKKD